MYYLSNISKMPTIPGVDIPNKFYWVLDEPAPLAGMKRPGEDLEWSSLKKAGFQYVINLWQEAPSYEPGQLTVAHCVKLEDLIHGGPPEDSTREELLIRNAVQIVLSKLIKHEGVLIHCWGGRGRTGTVIGCVLKSLGYKVNEIIQDLNALHLARGKDGWPESEWQSEILYQF